VRCFPDCGAEHRDAGFCGQPILVHCSLTPSRGKVRVYGELALATNFRWRAGEVFTEHAIAGEMRTQDDMNRPLLQADFDRGRYSFPLTRKGWHYGWTGSKHTSELEHAFLVYVCAPYKEQDAAAASAGGEAWQVLGAFRSPRFTMYCRRRHHTVAEEDKNQAAPPLADEEMVCVVALNPDGSAPVPAHAWPGFSAAAAASALLLPSPPKSPAKRAAAKKRRPAKPASEDEEDGEDDRPYTKAARARPASTRKKQSLSSVSSIEDAKLVRVLSAICKLDELQAHEAAPTTTYAGPSVPAQMQQDDFAWLEPISELFTGADLFEDVADILNLDTLVDLDAPRSRAVEVVTALAHYLVSETALTDAIHSRSANGSTFEDFLHLVELEIGNFLSSHFSGMTIDHLDAMLRGEDPFLEWKAPALPSMRSAFETLVSAAVSRAPSPIPATTTSFPAPRSPAGAAAAAAAATNLMQKLAGSRVLASTSEAADILPAGITLQMLLEPKPLGPEQAPPNVAGMWLRPEEGSAEMEKMREKRDVDWIQRQLLAQMEKRFELLQPTREDVVVHLARKLLSPGIVHYHLDAVVRPFDMTSPLGSTPAAKTGQCWGVGPVCVFRNTYNDHERMQRCNWKRPDGNLHGLHIYESVNGEGWGTGSSSSSDASAGLHSRKEWIINKVRRGGARSVCGRD
jgi:hypothetical protein